MAEKKTAPYGSWKSPVTPALVASAGVVLGNIALDGDDVYWIEGRPAEAGRNVVVRRPASGATADVTPAPYNARSRVHEYGGGAYTVRNGTVYFSNFSDNRLYRCEAGRQPEAVTSEGTLRYADFVVDEKRGRLISVREDHNEPEREAANTLVAIDLATGEQRVLVEGNDFYAAPRLSPDGSTLAWLTWNHPNMPWDGSELWTGSLGADGSVSDRRQVAGGPEESIFQPEWSPDGTLYFASDRTGWWNIYRLGDDIEVLIEMEAEFGTPAWAFGMSTYAFESAGTIVCAVEYSGRKSLATIDTVGKTLRPIDTQYSSLSGIRSTASTCVFLAGTPRVPAEIVRMDISTGESQVLQRSSDVSIDAAYLSIPESIEFPTENGLTAHAFYYPPCNDDFVAPAGDFPPLIVRSHGGPTGITSSNFALGVQFWTSRGFAVVDVNYGGSSGYGRAYRERLNGQWGVVDVDDCCNAARYLIEKGLADPDRLIIVGGSAGGYTTLSALAFRDTFKAGASHFGIADLVPFARETHKFESRYLDRLIGPYSEDDPALYRERSPINASDRLSCPVILFQGLDDKVVPPNQAEIMAAGMQKKGLPYAHVAYEGEGHGFRKSENIQRTLEAELYFYSRVFGFDLADPVEPVTIENLPRPAQR